MVNCVLGRQQWVIMRPNEVALSCRALWAQRSAGRWGAESGIFSSGGGIKEQPLALQDCEKIKDRRVLDKRNDNSVAKNLALVHSGQSEKLLKQMLFSQIKHLLQALSGRLFFLFMVFWRVEFTWLKCTVQGQFLVNFQLFSHYLYFLFPIIYLLHMIYQS